MLIPMVSKCHTWLKGLHLLLNFRILLERQMMCLKHTLKPEEGGLHSPHDSRQEGRKGSKTLSPPVPPIKQRSHLGCFQNHLTFFTECWSSISLCCWYPTQRVFPQTLSELLILPICRNLTMHSNQQTHINSASSQRLTSLIQDQFHPGPKQLSSLSTLFACSRWKRLVSQLIWKAPSNSCLVLKQSANPIVPCERAGGKLSTKLWPGLLPHQGFPLHFNNRTVLFFMFPHDGCVLICAQTI